MAALDIVSLADAKAQLNITDSASDTELAGYVSGVSAGVELHVGAVINRNVTEVFDGGRCEVLLTTLPVASVTSVTDNGTVVDPSGYKLNAQSGVLTRVAGPSRMPFLPGIQSVSALYVAGRAADIAAVALNYANIRLGTLMILQDNWESQRGPQRGPYDQQGDTYDPRTGYFISYKARALLGIEEAEAVGFA